MDESMTHTKFDDDIQNGGIGEHVVWNFLVNNDNVSSVIDVRKIKRFQENDVDFLVTAADKETMKYIEVKTDFKADLTGNLVYELTTSGNVGCFEKTKADYIYYYLPNSQTLYVINAIKLRAFVKSKGYELVKMGDSAEGYLVPISDLLQSGVIIKIYKGVK